MDSTIICIYFKNTQPPISLKINAEPDQEHVGHCNNTFTETGLDFFIKYLLRAI